MTRLQRATLYNRTLTAIKRAAVPTMADRVQVDIRVTLPVSRELFRALQCYEFTKGASPEWSNDWTRVTLSYPVKTCYPEHLPGFAREVLRAMKQAKREGKRLVIVRYPCEP